MTAERTRDRSNATCGGAELVCTGGTYLFSMWSPHFKPGGQPSTYPYSEQAMGYGVPSHVSSFDEKQLPVDRAAFNALAKPITTSLLSSHLKEASASYKQLIAAFKGMNWIRRPLVGTRLPSSLPVTCIKYTGIHSSFQVFKYRRQATGDK